MVHTSTTGTDHGTISSTQLYPFYLLISTSDPQYLQVINTSVQSLPQNPYSAFHTTTKPALGPSFTFLCDETLWLSSAHYLLTKEQQDSEESRDARVFIAEVFRSHSTVSSHILLLVI